MLKVERLMTVRDRLTHVFFLENVEEKGRYRLFSNHHRGVLRGFRRCWKRARRAADRITNLSTTKE
jgi:hypothetical protein